MSKVTIGLHGHVILSLLYLFGALTQPQIARITGLHISTVKKQIAHLVRAGYVARALDVARWKLDDGPARSGYYLTVPSGAKRGADALGIENDYLALKDYRRIRLPGTVAHRLLGNEYLLAVIEAARAAGFEAEEVSAESYYGFPIFGKGTAKSDRADSPWRYTRIVPDGTFTLGEHRYLLEVETGSHDRRELVGKLNDYASRWRRILRPNRGEKKYHDASARLEPLIILTPTSEHKRMRDYLRENLPKAPDWAEADALIKAVSGGRAEPGQLVVVAGIDEVRRKDEDLEDEAAKDEARKKPLSRVYRPLYKYPEEHSGPSPSGVPGWRVSLSDAGEISSRIPVPEEPPDEVLEETPLGEQKKEDVA